MQQWALVRTPAKLALLSSLYFSQGLPFGFFAQALPVLLRKDGVSLAAIGSASILALPWTAKFLWAPYVDRYGTSGWGARRGWILPLQASAALLMAGLGFVRPAEGLSVVFAGVFLANLIAATQDIATDALAIDLLSERERGLGNGVQVAGYRVGMIVSGGLLLVVFDRLGWMHSFWIIAGLLMFASVPVWWFEERPRSTEPRKMPGLMTVVHVLRKPSLRSFLPVLLLFKAGDAFGTAMLRPWLVDTGLTLSEIGWLVGTIGFVAGLFGALAGGILVGRMSRRAALAVLGASHGLSLGLYAVCAAKGDAGTLLTLALVLEHALGGMATAALFTTMMDHTHPETAATDYTVQASVLNVAAGAFGVPSGLVAQAIGYPAHFALAVLLAMAGAWCAFRFTGGEAPAHLPAIENG